MNLPSLVSLLHHLCLLLSPRPFLTSRRTSKRNQDTGILQLSWSPSMSCMRGTSTRLLSCELLWPSAWECELETIVYRTSWLNISFVFRETKTVNAWFQNKRASSKKRTTSTRGVPYEVPVVPPTSSNSSSTPPSSLPTETEDFPDDDLPLDGYSRSDSMPGPDGARSWSSFYAGNPDHQHFLTESDNMPRRMRMRPSPEQTHQLRKLYNSNPHPSTEQRQALAERIGM